ncbi:hypothetical protein PanWU01x14_199880, partial [Parasponia andersonii]
RKISVKAPDDCFANANHEWGPHIIKCRVGVAESPPGYRWSLKYYCVVYLIRGFDLIVPQVSTTDRWIISYD